MGNIPRDLLFCRRFMSLSTNWKAGGEVFIKPLLSFNEPELSVARGGEWSGEVSRRPRRRSATKTVLIICRIIYAQLE